MEKHFLGQCPFRVAGDGFGFLQVERRMAEAKGEKFDLSGSIIYCFGLVAIIYGFSSFSRGGQRWGPAHPPGCLRNSRIHWVGDEGEKSRLNIDLFRGNRPLYCRIWQHSFIIALPLRLPSF